MRVFDDILGIFINHFSRKIYVVGTHYVQPHISFYGKLTNVSSICY